MKTKILALSFLCTIGTVYAAEDFKGEELKTPSEINKSEINKNDHFMPTSMDFIHNEDDDSYEEYQLDDDLVHIILKDCAENHRTLSFEDDDFDLNRVQHILRTYLLYPSITTVDLPFLEITRKEVPLLGMMLNKTLTALDLTGNEIGTEGTQYLSNILKYDNSALQKLSLEKNSIGIKELQYILEMLNINQTLTSLNLNNNKIGTEGARNISNVLSGNTSLKELQLHSNDIGTEGAQYILEMLYINQTLTSLNLNYNEIEGELMNKIKEEISYNKSMQLIWFYPEGNDGTYKREILNLLKTKADKTKDKKYEAIRNFYFHYR